MSRLEIEAREWFLLADKDKVSFEVLSQNMHTAEPALFHAQQGLRSGTGRVVVE